VDEVDELVKGKKTGRKIKVVTGATITVTETTVTRRDDKGNVTDRGFSARATATIAEGTQGRLSQHQLDVIGTNAAAIAEGAHQTGVAREVAFAIAEREGLFGSAKRNVAFDHQNPEINPLQLTRNQFNEGEFRFNGQPIYTQPNTNRQHNILFALLLFQKKASGASSLEQALHRYGPGTGEPGGASYGPAVTAASNRIGAEISNSSQIRNSLPRFEPAGMSFRRGRY
jgi:hypothetical protein